MCDNMCDDLDINRHIRSTYNRGNAIISKFRKCSLGVKTRLFKAYCCSFYGATLWSSYRTLVRRKSIVSFKQVFRSLFKCQREKTSELMVALNIDTHNVILRKLVFSFKSRLFSSENVILTTIVNSLFFNSSSIYKE